MQALLAQASKTATTAQKQLFKYLTKLIKINNAFKFNA